MENRTYHECIGGMDFGENQDSYEKAPYLQ